MEHSKNGLHSHENQTLTDPVFLQFMATLNEATKHPPQPSPAKATKTGGTLVSLPPRLPVTWQDLQHDYNALHRAHTRFLFKHGVQLPRPGSQHLLSLIYLYRHMGNLVSLEGLRLFIQQYMPGGSADKQPRHLKYKGWHIVLGGKSGDLLPESVLYQDGRGALHTRAGGSTVPKGHLMLVSVHTPTPDFVLGKRQGGMSHESWQALCAAHNHCCAVCGRSGPLEKGHMDPSKGCTLDNMLPMCGECNNHASSDLVFDSSGRIAAVASERFVRSANLATRLRIFDALRKDKTVNINRI